MDIDLTEKGRQQAGHAGKLLELHGFEFDEAHTSVLKRAVRTLWTALHSSNQHWIPIKHTWRLNERHYGALTGLSKTEAGVQLGEDMLLKYRRGYAVDPIPMTEDHPCWTGTDRRYRDLGALLPRGESLKQCKERILPYWYESIVPSVRSGRRVLVAAHNNVIRCLCKHLDGLSVDRLRDLEIPTGAPLVYTLDRETLKPVGEPDELGFRGKFLKSDDYPDQDLGLSRSGVLSPSALGSTRVFVNDVMTLESLQRESMRLGLDMNRMKVVTESIEEFTKKASVGVNNDAKKRHKAALAAAAAAAGDDGAPSSSNGQTGGAARPGTPGGLIGRATEAAAARALATTTTAPVAVPYLKNAVSTLASQRSLVQPALARVKPGRSKAVAQGLRSNSLNPAYLDAAPGQRSSSAKGATADRSSSLLKPKSMYAAGYAIEEAASTRRRWNARLHQLKSTSPSGSADDDAGDGNAGADADGGSSPSSRSAWEEAAKLNEGAFRDPMDDWIETPSNAWWSKTGF